MSIDEIQIEEVREIIPNILFNNSTKHGFISVISKTELVNHYKSKYGFKELGNHLYLELERSQNLIKKYLEDE